MHESDHQPFFFDENFYFSNKNSFPKNLEYKHDFCFLKERNLMKIINGL